MLEVESLTVPAGRFRLEEVNLRLTQGECHAVLGPSGSGKSTLLRAILGVLPCAAGRICLNGADLAGVPIERRGLGYVPQHLGLFPHLTVGQNVAYSARARGVPSAVFQPHLDRLIAATGIGALLDRRPGTLSGGERQRVGLVRALAGQPRLVLLDEPFTALNDSLRRELWWLVRELRSQWGLTILLVTHDLAEAYFLADRVTVLLDGRVAQQGDKAEVYSRPAVAEVARFLGVETLQPGRIIETRDGMVLVEVNGTQLRALDVPGLSNEVLVNIRAEDVLLEREPGSPAVGSARNRLRARVLSIQFGSPMVCVKLDAGFPLLALITRSACEELNLQPESVVTAIIKAPSIHLLNRKPSSAPATPLSRSANAVTTRGV
ncbi:MAG: ABC transporter ATP-binding protein [Planctomycetia bacterium]|nr:MAG: ABC transporter ATP-binding protein [Planctomycetia bacterium]